MITQQPGAAPSSHPVPDAKETSLGLYVTAQEAYEMWKASPEEVKVLDVRMVEEYVFIGHAAMAVNIPVALPKYQWHADKRKYGFEMNPDFIDHVREVFKPDDTIVAMCRSGGRSAFAINLLAKAGFTKVWNIIDGFEGDPVDDPDSVYHGKRMKNGWKNSAPWTYDLDPTKVWIPTGEELATLRNTLDV
ncbi:MAG: sulfurtransferase [Anaerolineae bacterium]|nr:sulfurtransferase [Anaerolineae bacterium]